MPKIPKASKLEQMPEWLNGANVYRDLEGRLYNIGRTEDIGPLGGRRILWEIAGMDAGGGWLLCDDLIPDGASGCFPTKKAALQALLDAL